YAAKQGWLDGKIVIMHGFSMGSFVTAHTAFEKSSVDGVILQATASSPQAWAEALMPFFAQPFVRIEVGEELSGIDNVQKLIEADVPVLIISGGEDDQTPADLAEAMVEELNAAGVDVSYHEFPDARHNTIAGQPGYTDVVTDYIETLKTE
ncbi:MAG TPA: prolyl oligopeptidase family serine peptidase, partial [Gammaproteobacteria bacterium]|nr:prolyl oligopeptidase family serine peptidase [Gammaproteobacteria bacterium]